MKHFSKKYHFLIGIALSAYQLNAQTVNPATQADLSITTTVPAPPANSGIDLAPHGDGSVFDLAAIAYDDPTASYYEIKWIDPANNVISTQGGAGGDPDVAYYSNPDLTAVGYCDWSSPSTVWLDVFVLTSFPGPPPTYAYIPGNINYIGNGEYPNIDINSFGDGAYCYEDGGQIKLLAFTPSGVTSFIGPTVTIGSGTQPDVIVTDDNDYAVVTFVNGADLNVIILDYPDLQSGIVSVISNYNYTSRTSGFAYPRIASSKMAGTLSPLDFSVVVEDQTSGGTDIVAFSFFGLGLAGQYTVNQGLTGCTNSKPVVTYTRNKIVYSWSADYSSCFFSVAPPNATHTDVLLREYDGMSLSPLNGGDYFEVNMTQGSFYQSNIAIGSEKDGNYTSSGKEATVYSDAGDIFWKYRAPGTFYEPAKVQDDNGIAASSKQTHITGEHTFAATSDILSNQLKLMGNPVRSTITLYSNDARSTNVRLLNASGQEVNLEERIVKEDNQIKISVSDLSRGIYFLEGEINGYQKVMRVSCI